MNLETFIKPCAAVCFTTLSLWASAASANTPSQHFTQGGQGSGAATEQLGSIFFNPAVITSLPNNQIHLDLTTSWRTGTYTRKVDGQEDDPARLLSFDLQPNLAFSRQLGDTGLSVGLALGRGYLDRTHWLDASEGAQRRHSIYSGLRTWTLSPTAAYAFGERFSLGANVQLTRVHAYGYQSLDYGPFAAQRLDKMDIPDDAPGNEGRAHMDFKGNAGAVSVGAMFSPNERTSLGLNVLTPSHVEIAGEVSVYSPRNAYYEEVYGDEEEARATLKTRLPGKIQFGVAHELSETLSVQADLELVQWSTLDQIEIDVASETLGNIDSPDRTLDTSFRDVGALRLGMTRRKSAQQSTFIGLGYASSPVADEHLSPAWFYGHTVDATYGMRFPIGERRTMGVAYTQRVMLPREVEQSEVRPSAAGRYSQYAGFLNVSFDWEIANRTQNLPEVQRAPKGATELDIESD